jgi:hypothetical protein
MDRVNDKHGAVLVPNHGQRIRRLHPSGKPVSGGTSYVLDVREENGRVVVDYEELVSLKRGTTLPDRVEVLRSNAKNPTHAEKQHRVDKEAAEHVSQCVSKRRKGMLR